MRNEKIKNLEKKNKSNQGTDFIRRYAIAQNTMRQYFTPGDEYLSQASIEKLDYESQRCDHYFSRNGSRHAHKNDFKPCLEEIH